MVSLQGMKMEALEKVSVMVSMELNPSDRGSFMMKSMATEVKGRVNESEGIGNVLRSVDRSVRLGRLGVCPECLMAEVGKSWTMTKSVQRSDG
jgi:hypothetical protein